MSTSLKLAAVVCSIGVGACASASAIAAEAPGASKASPRRATMPVEGVAITNPDWARLPDTEVLVDYYPPLARYLGLRGKARLQCNVTEAGALDACVVLDETPPGMGFGNATLSAAQFFRMKPMTVDGAPVAGGKVVVPLNWQMADMDLISDPNADSPPPSAEALALGRRLFAATGGAQRIAANIRTNIARTTGRMGSAASTPEGRAALAALDKAVDPAMGVYEETMAVAYAKAFSIADLERLATFFESPAGQAWRAHDEALQKAYRYADQQAWLQTTSEARRAFCATTACAPGPSDAGAQAKPAEADQRAKP